MIFNVERYANSRPLSSKNLHKNEPPRSKLQGIKTERIFPRSKLRGIIKLKIFVTIQPA
jgi:hypothetical protein